jgi:cysteine desulfurase / selenocysteine lyase
MCGFGFGMAKIQDPMLLQVRGEISSSGDYIHLDNINSSPMPKVVLDIMKNGLDLEHLLGSSNGGMTEMEFGHSNLINNIYQLLGKLVNSSNPRDEIAIIESGTRAWSVALTSIPLTPGDIVLLTKFESGCNYLNTLHYTRRMGADVMYIPSDNNGKISLIALKSMLESIPKIRIVCVTWIPSNGASPNDIYECGKILSSYPNVVYLLDGNLAVGHQPIDVCTLQCHLFTGSSNHYLRSPHGIDFLYISPKIISVLCEPAYLNLSCGSFIDLQSYTLAPSALRYQILPSNSNLLIGFEASLQYYLSLTSPPSDPDPEPPPNLLGWPHARLSILGNLLVSSFLELQTLSQDQDSHCRELIIWNSSPVSGILCFTINGISCHHIRDILRSRNIFLSLCRHPEDTYLDALERRLPDRLRVSLHYFNTEIEIFILCDLLKELIFEE